MRRFSFLLSLIALGQMACGGSTSEGAQPAADDTGAIDETGGDATPTDTGAVDSGPDVDNGKPSDMYPAPHPPLPTLSNPAGGPVLKTPKVYIAYFSGYEYAAQVETFAKNVGATNYWKEAVGEFEIGPITYVDKKVLTETAPTSITADEVEAFMNAKITAGEFGTPDPNTIYTIFYPQTTTITMDGGFGGPSKSCSSFGGYHSDTAIGTTSPQNVPFAVLPTCKMFGPLVGLDGLTGALSHEWAEAATDPYPSTNMGADSSYSSVDNDHVIWNLLGGAENGDLCAQRDDAFWKTPGFDFVTQSVWSNVAAKKGGDPCAPKPTGVYFNAAPVLDEKVTLNLGSFGGGSVPTKGVKIAKGESKTIEVDLFSDGPTPAWKVTAIDAIARFSGGAPSLEFTWDKQTGQNGEKLHLTIKVVAASSFGKAHPFILVSTAASGKAQQIWPGLVSE